MNIVSFVRFYIFFRGPASFSLNRVFSTCFTEKKYVRNKVKPIKNK